jgi:CRISPR-associated protein Cas6
MNNFERTGSDSDPLKNNEPKINVRFPILGKTLPADHGYALYSAVTRKLEEERKKRGKTAETRPLSHELPENERWLAVELISGIPFDKSLIALPSRGAGLNLRLPADKFGEVLPLAGKRLEIDGHTIRLGIPFARPLTPAASLYSRIVTFRNSLEIPKFLETAKREFAEKEIEATLELPKEGRSRQRRIITIKGQKIVGFSLITHGLNDEDSIKLQSLGIGGRRSMGCGIFNPIYEKRGEVAE